MHRANQAIEAATEGAKMLNLVEKYFKAAIINMSKDQRKACFKKLRYDDTAHEIKNISKEIHIFREFPGSPVVRTPCFHCRGPGFNPWSGN